MQKKESEDASLDLFTTGNTGKLQKGKHGIVDPIHCIHSVGSSLWLLVSCGFQLVVSPGFHKSRCKHSSSRKYYFP